MRCSLSWFAPRRLRILKQSKTCRLDGFTICVRLRSVFRVHKTAGVAHSHECHWHETIVSPLHRVITSACHSRRCVYTNAARSDNANATQKDPIQRIRPFQKARIQRDEIGRARVVQCGGWREPVADSELETLQHVTIHRHSSHVRRRLLISVAFTCDVDHQCVRLDSKYGAHTAMTALFRTRQVTPVPT